MKQNDVFCILVCVCVCGWVHSEFINLLPCPQVLFDRPMQCSEQVSSAAARPHPHRVKPQSTGENAPTTASAQRGQWTTH